MLVVFSVLIEYAMPETAELDFSDAIKRAKDLDQLALALSKTLVANKTWSRQLLHHLREVARLSQVLRMTISMARPNIEVMAAAEALRSACRDLGLAAKGSRANTTTKISLQMLVDLSSSIYSTISVVNSEPDLL